MSLTAAEARRLAIAAVIAVHDRDAARLAQLVVGVPAGSMLTVIYALAALADEGVLVAAGGADDGRRVLCDVALDLAADPD